MMLDDYWAADDRTIDFGDLEDKTGWYYYPTCCDAIYWDQAVEGVITGTDAVESINSHTLSFVNHRHWMMKGHILRGRGIIVVYPLVTHDPNMLKNKSRGNLVGKIKVSLPEGKYQNFC